MYIFEQEPQSKLSGGVARVGQNWTDIQTRIWCTGSAPEGTHDEESVGTRTY